MNRITLGLTVLLAAFWSESYSQAFDHPEIIKKKKMRKLYASKEIKNGEQTSEQENYSYWEFDGQGREILELDFDGKGDTTLLVHATYKNGQLHEIKKDKRHLDEIELISYTYDDENRLVHRSETRNGKPVIAYHYYYGDDQVLDSVVWLGPNNKKQLAEYFTYENGRLTEISEKTSYGRLDGRTEISYHEDGTLKEEKLYDGFGDLFEHLTYNEDGLMVKRTVYIEEKKTTYTYEYKGNGLMKQSTKTKSEKPEWMETISYKWKK